MARFLIDLCSETGEPVGNNVRLQFKVTHQELANLIGSIRETVTSILSDFRRQGLIQQSQRFITILDLERFTLVANHGADMGR
ncbi:helix-turn-helix domain-containing protein [Candidatus Manganitrophus noduliformans]|uniref:helix-turn-helix domain-containing protein n=1 Tax=Candidatus Manganitrophus noduliformans TaxID=2606439 RepID=UPI001438C0E2|nr:helix-turn-helix domain-containing protein [Candidatus Manganitrophus noduliformans]